MRSPSQLPRKMARSSTSAGRWEIIDLRGEEVLAAAWRLARGHVGLRPCAGTRPVPVSTLHGPEHREPDRSPHAEIRIRRIIRENRYGAVRDSAPGSRRVAQSRVLRHHAAADPACKQGTRARHHTSKTCIKFLWAGDLARKAASWTILTPGGRSRRALALWDVWRDVQHAHWLPLWSDRPTIAALLMGITAATLGRWSRRSGPGSRAMARTPRFPRAREDGYLLPLEKAGNGPEGGFRYDRRHPASIAEPTRSNRLRDARLGCGHSRSITP